MATNKDDKKRIFFGWPSAPKDWIEPAELSKLEFDFEQVQILDPKFSEKHPEAEAIIRKLFAHCFLLESKLKTLDLSGFDGIARLVNKWQGFTDTDDLEDSEEEQNAKVKAKDLLAEIEEVMMSDNTIKHLERMRSEMQPFIDAFQAVSRKQVRLKNLIEKGKDL